MVKNYSTRYTGAQSESAACEYLIQRGYRILERNFYCRHGELDVIASEGRDIVFVEVKSIVANAEVSPFELLSKVKLQRLQRSIDFWLIKHNFATHAWRFEFVAIVLDEHMQVRTIEHIPEPEL